MKPIAIGRWGLVRSLRTLTVMKTIKTNAKTHKQTDYMTVRRFADLKRALKEALAFERGARCDLKVTRILLKPVARKNQS